MLETGKAYLLLDCVVLSMSGFISGVPFITDISPYQTDEIAGPSYSVICVGWFEGLGRNVLLLELLPFGRPSTKDELVAPNAGLAFNKGVRRVGIKLSGIGMSLSQLFIPWSMRSVRVGSVWRNSQRSRSLVRRVDCHLALCSGSLAVVGSLLPLCHMMGIYWDI
jgi:hypothetical protein